MAFFIAVTSARRVFGLTGMLWTLIPKYPAALKNAACADEATTLIVS